MFQSDRKPPKHLGTKLFIAFGLLILLTGVAMFFNMIHVQLQWKQVQLQLAACTYDANAEEGYLKATSATEVVQVAPHNATSLFKMVQTAGVASIGKLRGMPAEQIVLEYSNGAYGELSLLEDGKVHLSLLDANGKQWEFHLGKCNYRSMAQIMSVAGGAIENAVWID